MEKKNLLIVDDSRVARMVVRSIIENLKANVVILEAANGQEALQAIRDNQVHAVLLDHGMPDKSGLEVAVEIRAEKPDILIYMLTANVQESMKSRAQTVGVGFIEKPATEEKIRDFLERTGS